MRFTAQAPGRRRELAFRRAAQFVVPFVNDAPDAAQEPRRAFGSGLAPFQVFFGRGREQHEQTHCVRAVDFDHLVGVYSVLLRLHIFSIRPTATTRPQWMHLPSMTSFGYRKSCSSQRKVARQTIPCVSSLLTGSSKVTNPRSRMIFVHSR